MSEFEVLVCGNFNKAFRLNESLETVAELPVDATVRFQCVVPFRGMPNCYALGQFTDWTAMRTNPYVVDISDGETKFKSGRYYTGSIKAIATLPPLPESESAHLVVFDERSQVQVINIETDELVARKTMACASIQTFEEGETHQDTTQSLFVGQNHSIGQWVVKDGQLERVRQLLCPGAGLIQEVGVDPELNLFVSVSFDKKLLAHPTAPSESEKCAPTLQVDLSHPGLSLCQDVSSHLSFVGLQSGAIEVWDLRNPDARVTMAEVGAIHNGFVEKIAKVGEEEGKYLSVASNGQVCLWRVEGAEFVRELVRTPRLGGDCLDAVIL